MHQEKRAINSHHHTVVCMLVSSAPVHIDDDVVVQAFLSGKKRMRPKLETRTTTDPNNQMSQKNEVKG